jgi:DNA-binding SARP family transcriptional activator/tetratricopeptide (TPR) repeat protein/DNA-binding XRE family transcriptional regulator
VQGYRAAAGLTQGQLASRAGVSAGAVRDIEQGRTMRPRPASVTRLAEALRLSGGQREELSLLVAGPRRTDGGAGPGRGPDDEDEVRAGLRLAVLGPLAAWRDMIPVALGPPRQVAVLGLLALHQGSGLSRAVITDALWREEPPPAPAEMIERYVSRLRRLLWPVPSPGEDTPWGGRAALSWDGARYRLAPGSLPCDLEEFGLLSSQAFQSASAGDASRACQLYGQALGLWRGRPLADLDILQDHPAVAGLDRRYADVVIEYADAAGSASRPGDALPHLWTLTGREPLDERAHARLMNALAATGQRAAALEVYEGVRRRLDEELGVRPGPELAGAHLHMVRHAASVAATAPGRGEPRTSAGPRRPDAPLPVLPRQLPHWGHFVGRTAELADLTGLLHQARGQRPGTVVISVIGGTAGVGKTALALHWAHQIAERFPDGQLYVDLRGYDPDQPRPAADALAQFLRALGVAGEDIPAETDERAARYRSLLAAKRVLVVADNAGSAEQVRPLLPGTPSSMAIVTSRDSLSGLVARDGARRLNLDLLPSAEAVDLLRALIGQRVDDDPESARALADQCAWLPLALRVAAELAVSRPAVPLSALLAELADQQRRLDLLDAGGDPRTAVRTVFSWSYRQLDTSTARAFRLAGLHPAPDLDASAAAALTGGTVGQGRQLLNELARAHLIRSDGHGRYGMHDLLRAYATELAAAQDTEDDRRTALTGLFDYYLRTAAAAMDTLFPAEQRRRPSMPPLAVAGPAMADPAVARSWLDAERGALVAVAVHAAARGRPGYATRLAAVLFRYLESGSYFPEAMTVQACAQRAAQRIGDRAAEATALTSLGVVDFRQGRCQQATDRLQQALNLCREAGDPAGAARALHNLGAVDFQQSRYQQAAHHFQQALTLRRELGDAIGESRTLGNLGVAVGKLGRDQEGGDHLRQALTMSRETGDQTCEAYVLGGLGDACLRQRRYQDAQDQHQQALALFRAIGNRAGEAYALNALGADNLGLALGQEATGHHLQALTLFREIGDRSGEAEALNGLGASLLVAGRPGDARAQHTAALGVARQIGERYEQARAHNGVACGYHAIGDTPRARQHWQEALSLYTALDAPEAAAVRARLACAGNRGEAQPSSLTEKQPPPLTEKGSSRSTGAGAAGNPVAGGASPPSG